MTTQSWSTRVRHDTDATFREWGSEFAAKLLAVGLTQTTDTGQINWVTVARPGTATEAGYEIWRFNDTAHATAPIFMRIGYGTHSAATAPRIQISFGTGTNGAGTLTGAIATSARNIHGSAAQATDTVRQSYMVYREGFFGVSWKTAASATEASFFICRTVDSNGDPTVTGAMMHWGDGTTSGFTGRQAFRFATTAAAYTQTTSSASGALGLNPQAVTSTAVGADIQTMLGFTITPRVEPLGYLCGIVTGEISAGSTFTATLVGSTPRTFICLPTGAGPFGSINAASSGGMSTAMIWE